MRKCVQSMVISMNLHKYKRKWANLTRPLRFSPTWNSGIKLWIKLRNQIKEMKTQLEAQKITSIKLLLINWNKNKLNGTKKFQTSRKQAKFTSKSTTKTMLSKCKDATVILMNSSIYAAIWTSKNKKKKSKSVQTSSARLAITTKPKKHLSN